MKRYIVKLNDKRVKRAIQADYPQTYDLPNLGLTLIVDTDRPDAKELLAAYNGVKRVLDDGPETPDFLLLADPDPQSRVLAGMSNQDTISLTTSRAENVDIYVIDSGVRLDHEDLEGRASLLYSFDDQTYDVDGGYGGHGTAVASCAAGRKCGIAKGARVYALRTDYFFSKTMVCMDKILEHHRQKSLNRNSVLNLSFSSEYDRYNEEIEALNKEGVLITSSAGNEGSATKRFPASYPEVISVGATTDFHPNQQNELASFSSYGDWVVMHAPGSQVKAADIDTKDAYRQISGTSFSSPFTAGSIATIIEDAVVRNSNTVAQVRQHLLHATYKDCIELTEEQKQASTPNKALNTAMKPYRVSESEEPYQRVSKHQANKAHYLNAPTLTIIDSKKGHHRLVNIFSFVSAQQGVMINVATGFETNLDSLPRIPLIYTLLKNKGVWAAIIHDYLYRFAKFGEHSFTRVEADRIYREAMSTEGVGWFSRWLLYLGVRAIGWHHWSKYRKGKWSNTLKL